MNEVLPHIIQAVKTYGREIIAEKRIVYILADYGALKELPAERRILMDIIKEGYAEQLLNLQPDRQDNSLRICSFISELHKKTGYQVQKLIIVFKWLSDGLGIKTVPFETILQVEKETPIKEIFIKGTFKVKDPRAAAAAYTLPIDGLFKVSSLDNSNSADSADNILKRAVAKATEDHIKYVLSQYKIETSDINFIETTSMFFAIVSLASNIRMTKLIYLKDTIAESLAPNGCRLIVPIPGTNNVGIELLKENPLPPSFNSLMVKNTAQNELTCVLGLTPDGNPLSINIEKVGHILIGGQQSCGKTSALNTILLSLVCQYYPYEVKLALFDLKGTAFATYEDIAKPFLVSYADDFCCAKTETEASQLLSGIENDFSTRKSLFSKAAVSSHKEYNSKYLAGDLNPADGHLFLPRLIIAIDELTDIVNVHNAQSILSDLLSEGAKYGIHVIAATRHRIRRTMLSEEMKAAFQGKVSFRQETSIDSKSLLEVPDATNLYSVGDGLFLDTTSSTLSRFSSPCVDADLKKLIFQFVSSQPSVGEAYKVNVINSMTESKSVNASTDRSIDIHLRQAASILLQCDKCNEASLQKAMGCSFNTAHRILLRMD